MKVSLRPLKGEAFEVEAEPNDTVTDFKSKVSQLRPDFPAESLKLVFKGKVLQDGSTMADSGINDGDFIVVMVAKKKVSEPVLPVAASAAGSAPEVNQAATLPPAGPAVVPPLVSPPAAATAAATAMPGGSVPAATIQMLCEMGFPRSDVERALRAAFGNPDRAVEYLMSGIPPHLMPLAEGQAKAPAAALVKAPPPHGQISVPKAFSTPPPVLNATGPLAKLQNDPLFFRLKVAVQQNPGNLNQVLSIINQADPNLIGLIAENQEEFIELLQESMLPGGVSDVQTMGVAPTAPQAADASGGGVPPQLSAAERAAIERFQASVASGGGVPPQLSAADHAAIERLQALGFDKEAVVQAFISCDRNEELTANFLFDSGDN